MLNAICLGLAVTGVVFGLYCYRELWRWARQCQNVRIAIANNKRVQLQAPLTEWLSWANALSKDERTKGRVVYRNARVSVAIYRPATTRVGVRESIARARNARKRRKAPAPTE